ncbi:MAG: SpoIIE family protein phosphatase [Lachnospiraceae bacterium]|nr:SpoIIE family protein phosphatase [Lachnospiraceae bacterium]
MKKQLMNGDLPFDNVLPEYGRKKLLMYADSFRDLASTFADIRNRESLEPEIDDRQEYLWRKRLVENRDLMADHLNEMAEIMTQVAEESYRSLHISERKVKQLAHALKEENILLKEVFLLEKEDGHKEINLQMRAVKGANPTVEAVGNLLSVVLNFRLVPSCLSPIFVAREWTGYQYLEEPRFHVLTGVAKAVKETESISGDNYSFMDVREGSLTAVLSDGMGSGEKACRDSEFVIDLTEKFLEAGFSKETAVQMINGSLIAGGEPQNMSTLDMCRVDLYTGNCEFIKIGSAPSYIKRENLIEQISARNLPLGVFYEMDMEVTRRRLVDGDYIILVSDGILDALSQGIGEEMLPEMLGKIVMRNPSEIANHILNFCIHQSRGKIRDDMTVLVIGVWENL